MVANYQLDIVRNGGLVPLAKLITSNKLPLILSAVACIRNISIHPLNETPIIDSGFLPHLVRLLDRTEDEVLCHTVITMRNVNPPDPFPRFAPPISSPFLLTRIVLTSSWRRHLTGTKEHCFPPKQSKNASKSSNARKKHTPWKVR